MDSVVKSTQAEGGSKVFCCPECKTELDRDINGARNILLRYLTKKESV